MLMQRIFIGAAAFLSITMLCAACDDGRIYPEEPQTAEREGRVAKVVGTISGQDTWADGYEVVVAAFDGESDYALITKHIPSDTQEVSMTMNAIPNEATTVELCVIDRLRQRVATLKRVDIADNGHPRDTIVIEAEAMDAGMFAVIQNDVFTPRCATCHGLSSVAASGINLTRGNAYDAIVRAPSRRVPGRNIVEPGQSEASVLQMMLATDVSTSWGYDHRQADVSERYQEIITKWIDNGAKK